MKKLSSIVIIGRQNVGKSTLFNALAKKRIAIVSPTPGVTRDYIEKEISIEGKKFNLIDTGGITQKGNGDEIEYLVSLKTMDIIKKASLLLFVVDKKGVTPIDQEIADIIRKRNKRCIIIVNKVDTPKQTKQKELFAEFYSLGFDTIVPVSATHRNNFAELFEKILELSPTSNKVVTSEEPIKIAIVGKPNVGKSSILNKILNAERSLVTEVPGTTRDSIDTEITYCGKKIILIDTAGIRRKSRVKEDLEYYSVNRAIKSIKRSDIVLIVLSAPEGISSQDKKIFYLVQEAQKGAIIVINKWDLISKENKSTSIYKNILNQKFPLISHLPLIFTSAKTGLRISKILPLSLQVYENYNKRISTQEFNKFIQNIVNKYSPPQEGGMIKIFYGTQVSTKPPFFVLFTNNPHKIKDNYKRFLINKLREKFQFTGSPIILKFRKK